MKRRGELRDDDGSIATPVIGERPAKAITQMPALQTRISNLIALGLISALALGLLVWYYLAPPTQAAHAARGVQADRAARAAVESPLPPIEALRPVFANVNAGAGFEDGGEDAVHNRPERLPPVSSEPLLMQASSPVERGAFAGGDNPTGGSGSADLTLQRRLSGDAFSAGAVGAAAGAAVPSAAFGGSTLTGETDLSRSSSAIPTPMPTAAGTPTVGALSALLADRASAAASASLIPTQSLLLPKGSFIDCTLETAIDSSLPGLVTCITATDTFGANGRVVLLERGTKLVGETRAQVQSGSARVFVLWTEARTPSGVTVPLDSPGADELGRSGLPGAVQRHFWDRFGAAILLSVIDGAVEAGVQSTAGKGGTVIYSPGGAQDVMSEVLRSTIAIPPTVIKKNGDRVQVLVARDVDFRNVYELRDVGNHR